MTTITYDSYKVVNILTKKGFSKDQAEGILEAVEEADISRVATKDDIKDLRGEIKDLRTEMKELKADIYKFIITVSGVQIAAIGVLIAAFKLF